jgi:hypothetical protein
MKTPPAFPRIVPEDFSKNPPLVSLLVANIVTIVIAVTGNWDLATVLFIYWAQSVIIGFFTVMTLLGTDTAALAADMGRAGAQRGAPAAVSTHFTLLYKYILAGFFALHYGLFHWVYFGFIVETGIFGTVDIAGTGIWVSCGLFFSNHLFSFLYHRKSEPAGTAFVTEEFVRPYHRVIPMHLTILFGSVVVLLLQLAGIKTVMPVLVLFLVLKTYADLAMHMRKHRSLSEPVVLFKF